MRVLTCASGNLRQLNDLARNAKADYIVHTGDFGFYDEYSLDRIAEKWDLDSPEDGPDKQG